VAGVRQNLVGGEEIFDRKAERFEDGDLAIIVPGW
jgi:hypothetical protein